MLKSVHIVFSDVFFHSTSKRVQNGFQAVDLVLQLLDVCYTYTRLFALRIDTHAVVTSAPSTRRLRSVTFHLMLELARL